MQQVRQDCESTGDDAMAQRAPESDVAEIEAAVDERINQLRAQLIQDVVQMGESEEWSQKPEGSVRGVRRVANRCGREEQTRWLQTTGGEAVKLTRTYGACPQCGVGFFPLDEELGLLSGGLTPRGEETLARLASWMPYASAQELLQDLLGIQVSLATARRATLATGRRHWRCGGGGGAPQAGDAPSACWSRQASGEWGWGLCAPGRGRVGGSQDADDRGGHAQRARGGVHAAPLLLFATGGR